MMSVRGLLLKQKKWEEMRPGRWQGPQIMGALRDSRATGRWRQEVEKRRGRWEVDRAARRQKPRKENVGIPEPDLTGRAET